jgi:hypothetical protein
MEMSDSELELREIEMLMLQHLMEGENFGVGFENFQNRDMEAAQFKSDERGSVYRTRLVSQARSDGDLAELVFKMESEEDDRELKVVVGNSGFIRSRQRGNPSLVSEFVGNVEIIREYRGFLESLDSRISKYIHEKPDSELDEGRESTIQETKRGFNKLIRDSRYDSDREYTEEELRVFEALIANIGLEFCELNLSSDEYPDLSHFGAADDIDHLGKVSEFYEDYRVIVGKATRPNWDTLGAHIDYLLRVYTDADTGGEELTNLVDLIQWVENEYGL